MRVQGLKEACGGYNVEKCVVGILSEVYENTCPRWRTFSDETFKLLYEMIEKVDLPHFARHNV
jgi:hypothetical protein